MVQAGSWVNAPSDAIILGLKELPHSHDPVSHRHIYFAHAYKVMLPSIKGATSRCGRKNTLHNDYITLKGD